MREYSKAIPAWESDPSIFTQVSHKLGLSERFYFADVIGSLPARTKAAILVYNTRKGYESIRQEEEASNQILSYTESPQYNNIIWFEQTVENACGPTAMVHAIMNGCSTDDISK